ncbi:YCF48-related protein [Aureispira anguillae]|uniref:YCF48-related protein n=1 Tax=Aureispira anguillae TaxID=2864201 RepID=A0A915YJQ5_9BACT|nr:YCF48-related protein [Aureispira anguillae]BDS14477.1 YCF48-related protein [Aureispira anguillae]
MKKITQSTLYSFLAGLILIIQIGGCGIEKVSYSSQMHTLPTDLVLSDVCFINPDTGYVSAGGIFTAGLILRTQDGGTTWDTLDTYPTGVNSLSYQNGIFSASECGQKLHTSSDFNTWSFEYVSAGWWGWHKHIRLADNQVLLIGGENLGRGFMHHYAPNQGTITLRDTFDYELRDIEVTDNRTIHAVGYGLIMKSTDEGLSWIVSEITGDFFRGVDFPNDDVGYVVGEYGAVYKTTNRGDTWKACRAANSIFADQNKLLRDIAFWDENTGFLVGTNNLVYRTTNGGKTWKLIQNLDGYADFTSIRIQYQKAYLTGSQGKLLIIDLE